MAAFPPHVEIKLLTLSISTLMLLVYFIIILRHFAGLSRSFDHAVYHPRRKLASRTNNKRMP
jgi:hypothetical protein